MVLNGQPIYIFILFFSLFSENINAFNLIVMYLQCYSESGREGGLEEVLRNEEKRRGVNNVCKLEEEFCKEYTG